MSKPIPKMVSSMLPMFNLRADIAPETIDKDARTVELIWSTGAGVQKTSFWGDGIWIEVLSLDPSHVDLTRLNNDASLLDSHDNTSVDKVLGTVVKGWLVSPTEGRAKVRFGRTAKQEDVWQNVLDGIIKKVSIGYRIYEMDDITPPGEENIPVFRAINWEVMEISLVGVAADDGSSVRSESKNLTVCNLHPRADSAEHTETNTMPSENQTQVVDQNAIPPQTTATSVTTENRSSEVAPATSAEGASAERMRAGEILEAVRTAKLDTSFAEDSIKKGTSISEARKLIIAKWAEKDSQAETRSVVRVEGGNLDEVKTRGEALQEALLHRHDSKKNPLTDKGRSFYGLTLIESARQFLQESGVRTRGMSPSDIATRALNSSSDFPNLLANVANKTLRDAYQAAPQTWRPFTKETEANDFKPMSRTQLGDAPSLELVNESGEVKRGKISDAKESYSVATYAKVLGITRKTIINDDLQAFTRVPELFGRAAADLESDTVWAILTGNPNMADGIALFYATHNNLGTSGALSLTTVSEFRKLLRLQKGLNGRFINVGLKYLMVPSELETVAEQFVSREFLATKSSDINPFANKLIVLAEPRLSAVSTTNYFGAADPAQIDIIEVAYLSGYKGVNIETRQGFDVDGVEIKARLDFGAKALDFRGLVKNPN